MNTRRKLIVALGAGALAVPLGTFAQQPVAGMHRIGFLGPESPSGFEVRIEALRAGLRDLGYVEGKNIVIEFRWAEGNYDRLPGLAAELVQIKVNVIVASATPAVSAARKATSAIPIIMVNVGDPVGSGLINSLAAPGGNITGVTNVTGELSPKHLEMLHSMAPKVSRVAVLVNPANSTHASPLKEIQAAAKMATVKILPVEARNPQEIENGFRMMVRENAGAFIVLGDPFFNQQRRQIAELAARNRLPSIGPNREYAEAGMLLSYGVNRAENFRRAATYVDKIFKGAKPGDLPAEQPTKFELVINGKTAKALGLKIPPSLLIMADKVIE